MLNRCREVVGGGGYGGEGDRGYPPLTGRGSGGSPPENVEIMLKNVAIDPQPKRAIFT